MYENDELNFYIYTFKSGRSRRGSVKQFNNKLLLLCFAALETRITSFVINFISFLKVQYVVLWTNL